MAAQQELAAQSPGGVRRGSGSYLQGENESHLGVARGVQSTFLGAFAGLLALSEGGIARLLRDGRRQSKNELLLLLPDA